MVFRQTQTAAARFIAKVDKRGPDECWEWTASKFPGPKLLPYGKFYVEGKTVLAHRFSYELFVGPIPEGLTIDHLCRNASCVNPAHLEPCSLQINISRGGRPDPKVWANNGAHFRARTHCPKGHPYTPENTYLQDRGEGRPPGRSCLICRRASGRAASAKRKKS